MPELTEEELDVARKAVALIQNLQRNPEARPHFERATKVINPTYVTAEEQVSAIQAPLRAELDEIKAALKAREESDAAAAKKTEEDAYVARVEGAFGRLRQAHGLTDEGEAAVRDLMKTRHIYDPEAAFALFEKQNPAPRPEHASWTPDSWNYERDMTPDPKAWFADPDKAADDMVGQVLLEMRRNGSGE